MTDQDRLRKNALCDLLMKEGIEGRRDDDATFRTTTLTALGWELGRKDCLARALTWHEALERKDIRGKMAVILDYDRAGIIAEDRYNTEWQWEQATLAREIFYLRRAVSRPEFNQVPDIDQCMILNNLGNRLQVAGRIIEALDCWRRALEVQPKFGMALCNRAQALITYSEALEDPGKRVIFYWMAHKEASAALAPTAIYTHPLDKRNLEKAKELKESIESVVNLEEVTALDPLTWQDTSATKEDRDYRHWCLFNCLYLNPSNDLGQLTRATNDPMQLSGHVVRVDESYRFESFYNQMKQEYVSARWLLYEGLTVKITHFSDRDVILLATEPRPSLSLAIEKVKAAYRITYSLFDKIAFFLNAYMELAIPDKNVSFRSLWRQNERKPIRKQFDQTGNWGFCALYWLAKDFFEKGNDEVAEPQARGLRDIRNYLEHKYLRITVAEPTTEPPDDLALMVSREQFEAKALHLLKLARSALIYLAIGVGFEERRRQPGRTGMPIEKLPSTPVLPDDEKM